MKVTLTGTARKLRSETTDAESRLWRSLRNRQLHGLKFKRQVPFGPFIADFICVEANLIIEADGGQHADRADADRVRTEYFEAGGYRVSRFWNNDVLQNLDGVLEAIEGELTKKTPSPQPSPSKLALASLQLKAPHSLANAEGERELGCGAFLSVGASSGVPSPVRTRKRVRERKDASSPRQACREKDRMREAST